MLGCVAPGVSMKSGLGDRNNPMKPNPPADDSPGLNEVRSWRPEQFLQTKRINWRVPLDVSMKSGLGDRNNRP